MNVKGALRPVRTLKAVYRLVPRVLKKPGLPPGTPVYTGRQKVERPKIAVFDYDEAHYEERVAERIEDCFPLVDTPAITWINIDGLHDAELITKLGEKLELHPLVVEDIVSVGQRPKLEDHEKHLFIVLRMLSYNGNEDHLESEQLSLILGRNYVVSFQEREGDAFDAIRERIRYLRGRVRKMGADYLAYALIDVVVDHYFVILEQLGDRIEALEAAVASEPTPELLREIHHVKREILLLRKSVWPLREVVSGLERSESRLITKATRVFVRDLYDHTVQVIETVEAVRDTVAGMTDLYLSAVSNRMNEIMKVLTIMATIFIPLTFLAGVYGMNFRYMPELEWRWGYPVALGLMFVAAMAMIVYFRRKRWF
ncbi:MAG: magnesium/cobalt transporter CorA [Gemmatimonadetes bacterium]|nr:magnesium/cobalt transporter CorA [Gemmatimonadota bacterium]